MKAKARTYTIHCKHCHAALKSRTSGDLSRLIDLIWYWRNRKIEHDCPKPHINSGRYVRIRPINEDDFALLQRTVAECEVDTSLENRNARIVLDSCECGVITPQTALTALTNLRLGFPYAEGVLAFCCSQTPGGEPALRELVDEQSVTDQFLCGRIYYKPEALKRLENLERS